MSLSSREYWIRRALKREEEAFLRGAELSDTMFKQYQKAARKIREKVNDYYTRYAGRHGLTYEQAFKLLSRPEAQEWKAALGDYVDRIARATDPKVKALLTAELDALSYNSSITRLEALNGQINMILGDLYDKGVEQMKAEFGEAFTQSYYHKLFDIQSRVGYFSEIAKITPSIIDNILSYPWSGAMFSDRLWQNKQALLFNLREITTQGAIQGKGIAEMSREISSKMGQSYKAAERLIRTETNHFHNAAETKAYEAAGIEEYEFMATLDERTSDVCGALDGKVFKVKDAQAGVNFPPMHPNCRSTTIEHDPEDALDWAESGLEMPENMTYDEWRRAQDSGELHAQHLDYVEVTQEAIDRVPLVEVPELGDEASEKLQQAHKALLEEARRYPVDAELGKAFTLGMKPLSSHVGAGGSVRIPDQNIPYVAVHNHPDGGSFSPGDLRQFITRDNLRVLTAVGNDGDVYVIAKSATFDRAAMYQAYCELCEKIQPLVDDENMLEAVNHIEGFLKGVERFGARYYTGVS